VVINCFKILFQYLLSATEKTHKNCQDGITCPWAKIQIIAREKMVMLHVDMEVGKGERSGKSLERLKKSMKTVKLR
jgi:hypothetical protein